MRSRNQRQRGCGKKKIIGSHSTNGIWIDAAVAGIPLGCVRRGGCGPVVSLVPHSTTGYKLRSLRLHGFRPLNGAAHHVGVEKKIKHHVPRFFIRYQP